VDGRKTRPARVRIVRARQTRRGAHAVIELTIREGRNRQVRKMCDAIAHPIERLTRTRIGSVTARGLKAGQFRDLTPGEVRALAPAVSHS
jgi:pseudouridine synthase